MKWFGDSRVSVGLGFVMVVATTLGLSSCALGQSQAEETYVSGDGTVTEFAVGERGDVVEFAGTTDTGESIDSKSFPGEVVVVNFWYAACPPCRLEAPDLQLVKEEFEGEKVRFVGVNLRDGAETSLAFAETFGVTYPSIIDSGGEVVLAFSGLASPTAVPTTVVLDKTGRPSARIVGLLEPSTLRSLIRTALAED